jgi:kynurenine formamidase
VRTIFDLSQPVEQGMTIFPGDPAPAIQLAAGAALPWRVSELHLGSHTGTHIDSASHFIEGGKTIDQYPLERFVLPGVVISMQDLSDDQPISEELITNRFTNLPVGGAILIQTKWDQFWKTDRYLRHPYLSAEAALRLVQARASLVGIDTLNVDSTVQSTDHVHRILLENDILIVENLTRLTALQPGRLYQFSFLPIRLPGLDGSPVRAVAWANPIQPFVQEENTR